MVNSGPFDDTDDGQGDRNANAGRAAATTTSTAQPHTTPSDSAHSSSPVTACFVPSRAKGRSQTAESDAIGPTPTKTQFNSDMRDQLDEKEKAEEEKSSLCCRVPLDKVQGVLPPKQASDDGEIGAPKASRKLLCLYCDRTFVSANLRQKHVERVHSAKKNRRASSRKQSQCSHCDRLNSGENTLSDLFRHLVDEHSSRYFGCLPCEDRFPTQAALSDHNAAFHRAPVKTASVLGDQPVVKLTRSRVKPKPDEPGGKTAKLKELRHKKMSVKSSRIALKRRESKRLQALAKLPASQKRRPKPSDKRPQASAKPEQAPSTKPTDKTKAASGSSANPYPEFDNFYRVKKITDHSIDNLKISSLTFDDVFDKAFFNRIKCNIEDNLLHHIDGKLFESEESETRISNFEKVSDGRQEVQNASDHYGCELSLNAVAPSSSLSLNSRFGEDFESRIEYGAKPSKKKKQDEVRYKYFTRRKFQASILEQAENRDLSKLDMWTQLVIKKRQQKILDERKTAREMREYAAGDEHRGKLRRDELNSILDRRGPFEDLRAEASKKAALDKLNSRSDDSICEESFAHARHVLDEVLARVFEAVEREAEKKEAEEKPVVDEKRTDLREIPEYLNLQRSSSQHGDIDKSDRITLICSSQETENFELPTNQARDKNELVELSGEWARSRMYICAACGAKLPNMKYLLDHKTLYHQNVWVQHYEFVGNQSELYRHLSIPALGKVGAVENAVQCKSWKRSEARSCTKCGKRCNSLGELHRHVLECGGDWTWMLARKKCKYRPFGAKSRRKRRGLVQRIRHKQKTDPTEVKKKYKKTFDGPRQRPSDADTIQRMLANLPAKRSTRKLISLYDGVYRARKTNQMQQNVKQKKVKCGKMIYKSSNIKETTEKTINTARVAMPQKSPSSSRRSLRSLNRVLSSRILDTNSKLTVKRKIKVMNERRRTRQSLIAEESNNGEGCSDLPTVDTSPSKKSKSEKSEFAQGNVKRTSPRSSTKNIKKMTMKKLLSGNINIKSFFPVKKRENKKALAESQPPDTGNDVTEQRGRSNRKSKDLPEETVAKSEVEAKPLVKKTKNDTFGKLVRSLSLRKKKVPKLSPPQVPAKSPEIEKPKETATSDSTNEELDKSNKKRKLKRSFRNVINRVKRLKIDNAPETVRGTSPTNIKSTFLEERQPEKPNLPAQPVKIVVPSNSEAKENTADISETALVVMNFSETNESSIVPENIFKLESNNEKSLQAKGELDFDTQPDNKKSISTEINTKLVASGATNTDKLKPISIETSVKPRIVPLISPNMKGKIRKPARGLNDCIAMLTNKLQQKTTETVPKVGIFNMLPSKVPPKILCDPHPPKAECILRIPTFKTQDTVEETALDLTTKPKTCFASPPLFGKLHINNPLQNLMLPESYLAAKTIKKWSSVDRIIEDVVENRTPKDSTNPVIEKTSLRDWDSVDEIIHSVVNGYKVNRLRYKTRTTVDDIIDFVVAANACEEEKAFTPHVSSSQIIKSRSANDINLNDPVLEEQPHSSSRLQNILPDPSTVKDETNRRSETISDTIDFVVAGGSTLNDVVPIVETENVPLVKSKSKPTWKIGSIRKPKKKEVKSSVASEETPSKVEGTSEENRCTTSTEVQSRQDDVCDKNEEQKCPAALDNSDELNVPKDDAKSIPEPPDPIAVESLQSLDNIPNDSLDTTLNKAFIQSPEVGAERYVGNKMNEAARKVGQARKRSKQRKVISCEEKQSAPIIETHLDHLLGTKEMNNQTELSVSSFRADIIALSSEPQAKDLTLSNEDEPRVFENKIVVQHNTSDSEDDVPLISLLKASEINADENESTDDSLKCLTGSGKPETENGSCLLLDEQEKQTLIDQNKDSGIETDRSEENGSVHSEKINMPLQESPDLRVDEDSQKSSNEETSTEKSDCSRSLDPGSVDGFLPEQAVCLHKSNVSPRSADLEIKNSDTTGKCQKTQRVTIVMTILQKSSDFDDADELEPSNPSEQIADTKSVEPNEVSDSVASERLNDGDDKTTPNQLKTSEETVNDTLQSSGESNFSKIEDAVEHSLTSQIIENEPNTKPKPENETMSLCPVTNAEGNVSLPIVSEKNESPRLITQKKAKGRGKVSEPVDSGTDELSPIAQLSDDEITDSLPLSLLAAKEIPLVPDKPPETTNAMPKNIVEQEPLDEAVKVSPSASKSSEPCLALKKRKNKKKIGKRSKKKFASKMLLSVSQIMETTSRDILSPSFALSQASEPVVPESLVSSELSEIKSQTNASEDIHELDLGTTKASENLEEAKSKVFSTDTSCQSEKQLGSDIPEISQSVESNSKQLPIGAEVNTDHSVNKFRDSKKKGQRRSRSLKKKSETELSGGVDKSSSDETVYLTSNLINQVKITENIIPNDENSNIFTERVKNNENVFATNEITADSAEDKVNEASETTPENCDLTRSKDDVFLEPLNGNRPRGKKATKRRSRSSKNEPTSDNFKNEEFVYRDAKITFIGEPVVGLVRCETQMLSTVSEPANQSGILEPASTFIKPVDFQTTEDSNINQKTLRKRSASLKNSISSDSSSESLTDNDSESKNLKPKSVKVAVQNSPSKTPPKRRSARSDSAGSFSEPSSVGVQDPVTPIKRNSRSQRNDFKMPSSDDSPLSECRSSDREMSESDVEFKIDTPPKRSPRSLRTRNTVPGVTKSLQDATNEKSKEKKGDRDSESIAQVRKRGRSSRNHILTDDMSVRMDFETTGTEHGDSSIDSKPRTKSRISRSLEESFEVSANTLNDANDSVETISKGSELTEIVEKAPVAADGNDFSNSDIPDLDTKQGGRRTRSLKSDFKAFFSDDLDLDTETESEVTKPQICGEQSSIADPLTENTVEDVNKTTDEFDSLLGKELIKTLSEEVKEINSEIVASDFIETQLKPTRALSRSLRNNATSPATTLLPVDDQLDLLKNNENPPEHTVSSTKKPKTKVVKRSTSLKENLTAPSDLFSKMAFDTKSSEIEDSSISSDIEIFNLLGSETNVSKTKRLIRNSRFPKSSDIVSTEVTDQAQTETESAIEENSGINSDNETNSPNAIKTKIATRQIPQRRSKSLKAKDSNSAENLSGSENDNGVKMNSPGKTEKKPVRRSRSLKNLTSSSVSLIKVSDPVDTSHTKLPGDVDILVNPSIDPQLSDEAEKSDEKSLDECAMLTKRPSSSNDISDVDVFPDTKRIEDSEPEIEQITKRSRLAKTKTKSNALPSPKTESLNNIEKVGVTKSNERTKRSNDKIVSDTSLEQQEPDEFPLIAKESSFRSLRKKSAVNYSEIEENNDVPSPNKKPESVSKDMAFVGEDTEPLANIKKCKGRKTVVTKNAEEDSELEDPSIGIIPKISSAETEMEVTETAVEVTENFTNENRSCTTQENKSDTASPNQDIVLNGNILENTQVQNLITSTPKQQKKSTRNKKSFRKNRNRSKPIVQFPSEPTTPESPTKETDNSSLNNESNAVVTPEQPDMKEPPIKIIINTQKTRRKSKSIKKIGAKGQNDLFEDFALVIKKKRPSPVIAFTPPNTFAEETKFPIYLSKPTVQPEPNQNEEVRDGLDVSVEEMDMEIDEIPITSNIIENSLALSLSEEITDTEKIEENDGQSESRNNFESPAKENLEPSIEQDVPLDIHSKPDELSENKTEFVSPKKGKRKTKAKSTRKGSRATAKVNDPSETPITDGDHPDQSETNEKSVELMASSTTDSVMSCDETAPEECTGIDVIGTTKENPTIIAPVYKRIDNALGEPSSEEKDIDRIYAFSETEDFEIEKPVELPRRLPRIKETKVAQKIETSVHMDKCVPEEPPATISTKRKSKFPKDIDPDEKQDDYVEEIKDNDPEPEDSGRRKSMRSAKVKALEHIHDDALADLTESERKRSSRASKSAGTEEAPSVESPTKKNNSKKSKSQKPLLIEGLGFSRLDAESPILAELVAELHGLEELENSIERELNAEVVEKTDEKEPTSIDVLPEESNVEVSQTDASSLEENQERRRSRRGSKKIASYNENDLIEPLLEEIDGKRKTKKMSLPESKSSKKSKEPVKKLNSEELFDLLKASTTVAPKQQNSFLNSLQDTSKEMKSDNFTSIFQGEKSVSAAKEPAKSKEDIEKIYEFTESPENTKQASDTLPTKKIAGPAKQSVDDISSSISNSSFLLPTPDLQDSSLDSNVKAKSDKSESNYCDICNKSFIRVDNLIKHRRTLTHIQKLSELEAKEAEKSKSEEAVSLSETVDIMPAELPTVVAEPEIEASAAQSSFSNSHSLKLADIINDVLNKPVEEEHKFSEIVLDSECEPEVKRYKSLGERKSFDSDNAIPGDPFQSKTTILEKQISLLEGIIENQATNNYIDDISISSDSPSEMSSKLDDEGTRNELSKPLADDSSFLKPPNQYEEISEDSANLRNYEDQKLRKTLNRDEELFLECCSLLKSGSEVSSSYSNKRHHNKVMSAAGLRPADEPDWLEKKSLVREAQYEIVDDSDDNSRIPTPLGDSYDDDASNSNTISSNWDTSARVPEAYRDGKFHFEDISKEKYQDQSSLKFEGLLASNRTVFTSDDVGHFPTKPRRDSSSEGSASDAKKIITKGARKVFEGLKVSIPTEELDLEEVLNSSPKAKKMNTSSGSSKHPDSPTLPTKAPRKSKPVKKSQVGSNLLFKVTKKKTPSPGGAKNDDSKSYDVYDFEETQDNTDVFTKPDFRTFRTQKSGDLESETDSRDYLDPESVTSSTSSENITKKKCMIMGRIFKNAAAKSKIEDIDEEIRDIPTMDNEELVESYVANCKVVRSDEKPKLSEKEINILFDRLLENKVEDKEKANSSTTKTTSRSKAEAKKAENRKKVKAKGKKRARTNSESTDDEFSLNNKSTKKRSNRKNAKEDDNCINLEQELKECIGVASRKSQRKCTSGKQNVLVEYWSSDESQFEALLESQKIEVEAAAERVVAPVEAVEPVKEKKEFEKPRPVDRKPHKKRPAKRKAQDSNSASDTAASNRRKRAAANPLYHWSSSSEDEANDLIEVKPLRDELEEEEDRPVQHGWIVGESPKKLVMMLAQAKGKKTDVDCVKEQGKKRTSAVS